VKIATRQDFNQMRVI